jgi:regulator of protease activity HflC (stomatin/prohibitin superfamily)
MSKKMIGWSSAGVGVAIVVIAGLMFGLPVYNVWRAGKSGEAKLMQAEQEKQILIETAKAEVEAAKLRAEAIEIVGASAQQYPEYRLQEFMGAFGEALNNGEIEQIIYVPTECQIPIMEAARVTTPPK